MNRLVILAPNWLGDAVMALPAIADVRREWPRADLVVAARPSIAPLFRIVGGVNDVNGVVDVEHLDGGFDAALLLPNSFRSALLARRAGIPERWGYRTQWRAALLTRAIDPTNGLHQAEYYQHLVHALGVPNGPIEPRLVISQALRDAGTNLLVEAGWDRTAPLVALAPGAAYGGAKRWPPESFAELAHALGSDGVQCMMIGTAADLPTASDVARAFHDRRVGRTGLCSLVGKSDLPTLAGILANCRALVTNDSGAMHLAAACGIAVTAVFGPTDERATRPLGDGHTIITHPVWCRPCMLRECPLDHRCMLGIAPAEVTAATRRIL
jgi:lipopolysaccharide heptosyltransferase II